MGFNCIVVGRYMIQVNNHAGTKTPNFCNTVLVALVGEGKGPGCGFKFAAGSRSRVPYEYAFGAQNHTVIWAPNCTTTIHLLVLQNIVICVHTRDPPNTNSSTYSYAPSLPRHTIKRIIVAPHHYTHGTTTHILCTKQHVLAHRTCTHYSTKHPFTYATRNSPVPPSPQRH